MVWISAVRVHLDQIQIHTKFDFIQFPFSDALASIDLIGRSYGLMFNAFSSCWKLPPCPGKNFFLTWRPPWYCRNYNLTTSTLFDSVTRPKTSLGSSLCPGLQIQWRSNKGVMRLFMKVYPWMETKDLEREITPTQTKWSFCELHKTSS